MTQRELQTSVRGVVDQVVELVHPRRVILFGSAVDGKVKEDSDLDFLVVVAESKSTEEVTDRLNLGVRNRPMPCDFMVVAQSVLNKNRSNPGLVYGDILDHGREVYSA